MIYDKYYQTKNLFGKPYPELIDFFANCSQKGKVLDLGCGQGRDAIPIAQLGFEVVGIDNSKVGIQQMTQIAQQENLNLTGHVANIYDYSNYDEFDFVLFDSMFHFEKKDLEKETGLIKKAIQQVKIGCIIVFCIQNTKNKIDTLNKTIEAQGELKRLVNLRISYLWEDKESGHESTTEYQMIVVKK